VGRWQRYWFADGGRYAAAVVRITIATSVLLTLVRLHQPVSTGDLPGAHTLYRPVGIWMLLGHTPPPGWLVTVLWAIAWTSTVAMLVGLASRAATAASFTSGVAIAALSFAAQKTWSHQYNVVFLAQLAFLGAYGGDVLSVDALVRKLRKLPAHDRVRAYQWSLRLVQLAVALMFACAAFHKFMHGHFTLRWALSDNLRHQLLVRFDLAGLARPRVVEWIIDDPWKYKTAALLNLVSQATPILACVFAKRPVVRALCGLFFVIETIALGLVVDLWNWHWLPLYAVFIDWDWVLRRRGDASNPPPTWQPPRAARIFVIAFVAYDAITAIVPGIDQWLNTYPFSGFPMFSTVLAKPPYGEHQPYGLPGDHFVVTSTPPIDLAAQRWFDHANRGIYAERDPVKLRARLAVVLAQAQRRYPMYAFDKIQLWITLYVAAPYPERAHFESHPLGIVGELSNLGVYRTMLGKLGPTGVELAPQNVDATGATLSYYRDDDATQLPLAAANAPLEGDPIYVIATTAAGEPWLVASHADWKWQ
jgi:hypothetical protein